MLLGHKLHPTQCRASGFIIIRKAGFKSRHAQAEWEMGTNWPGQDLNTCVTSDIGGMGRFDMWYALPIADCWNYVICISMNFNLIKHWLLGWTITPWESHAVVLLNVLLNSTQHINKASRGRPTEMEPTCICVCMQSKRFYHAWLTHPHFSLLTGRGYSSFD